MIKNLKNKFSTFILGTLLALCFTLSTTSQAQAVDEEINDITRIISTYKADRISSAAVQVPDVPGPSERKKKSVASLSFAWNETVGMAAFFREEYLWVVFDQRQEFNTKELNSVISDLAHDLIQIPHSKGTIIRITLDPSTKIAIRKEGLLWIVDMFNKDFPYKVRNMEVQTQNNSVNEPYIYIPTTTTSNIISFIDPEIGDSIVAIPNTEAGLGLTNSYSYPDLEFLNSIQGLAAVPISGDLIFSKGNTGVTIKALNRGLYISPDLENLKRRKDMFKTTDNISSLDEQIPYHNLSRKFNDVVDEYRKRIEEASEDEIYEIKFEFAQYFVGMGMGSEALTLLKEIETSGHPIAQLEKFHALVGISDFLLGRYADGLEEFSYKELPTVNEAVFWRTIISSAIEFKKEDNIVLQSFMTVLKNYPSRIKARIAIRGAENAIRSFDDMTAQNFIDILKSTPFSADDETVVDFLSAERLSIQGYPLNALKVYKKAAQGKNYKYSSFARKKVAELEYKLGISKIDQTIAELEKIKFTWGEKEFKLNILETLSELYIRNHDPYNALKSLQSALYLANEQRAKMITHQMVSIFEDIYLHNQSDDLPALKSLAMYEDFEWLTPVSKHSNEIILRVADRLVAVDLLDRSSQMLFNLLSQKNLTSEEKSKIGARIALIYLFKDNSNEALNILNRTEQDNMSLVTASQRKIIKAKALSNLGRDREALELLKDDTSKNAFILKSELYWNAGLWDETSQNLKFLVENPEEGKDLSKEQISLILDWITALKMAGKETVIARVKNKFQPYFENTKYLSTFNILTNALDKDVVDIKYINKAVEDIKAYSNFSKIYNDALRYE